MHFHLSRRARVAALAVLALLVAIVVTLLMSGPASGRGGEASTEAEARSAATRQVGHTDATRRDGAAGSGATYSATGSGPIMGNAHRLSESAARAAGTAPVLRDIWVDPVNGRDSRTGATRSLAVRTVSEAWSRIPYGRALTGTGYRIQLVAGRYTAAHLPDNGWWEDRHGTRRFPVVIRSADGRGAAAFTETVSLYDVDHVSLVGVRVAPRGSGDVLHCELCNHVLLRRVRLAGDGSPQEVLKANQSRHLYVRDSNISGAWQNPIDFVAVQHGRITGNRIHDGGDWCIYVKGGSAYFRIDRNEIYDCGIGGFVAGQGTGFEFMTSPWLHYEAYDIKFVNNIVHDTSGAGMGVNGAYNALLAYNTLYRVGSTSHAIEIAQGARSCDGDVAACRARLAAGGWGTTGEGGQWIPNRNVFVYDNVLYNPPGFRSTWAQFDFHGPARTPSGSNVPSPARADTNLRIAGNVIWNGPSDLDLGVGSGSGCQPSNPKCNAAQLRRDNTINTVRPQLVDPSHGDFRPVQGGNVDRRRAVAIPDFTWSGLPSRPVVPPGSTDNSVPRTLAGSLRDSWGRPGAY